MNGTSEYSLTIVVPVFNEKDNIHNLEEALTAFLPSCKVKACVLFVDDGSTDGSLPLISEVCARHKEDQVQNPVFRVKLKRISAYLCMRT